MPRIFPRCVFFSFIFFISLLLILLFSLPNQLWFKRWWWMIWTKTKIWWTHVLFFTFFCRNKFFQELKVLTFSETKVWRWYNFADKNKSDTILIVSENSFQNISNKFYKKTNFQNIYQFFSNIFALKNMFHKLISKKIKIIGRDE